MIAYIEDVCERLESADSLVRAFLPEEGRRERLGREASALLVQYPEPSSSEPSRRPPLFGIPVGVKDLFRVDGFPTRAGSKLPPEVFAGAEASIVMALRNVGIATFEERFDHAYVRCLVFSEKSASTSPRYEVREAQ